MTSYNCQAAFDGIQNSLSLFAGACSIGFKKMGTGVNPANDKIEKLENMVQDLTSLSRTNKRRSPRRRKRRKVKD